MRASSLSIAMAILATIGLASGRLAVPAAAEEEFALVERATTDVVTDTGAAGDSAGDLLTFANELYDAHNDKLMGRTNGMCIRTAAGAAWECFFTVTLEDGQMTIAGPFYDGKDSVMAVTGGTGAYRGMGGEMALHARNEQGTEYDFRFTH